MGAKSLIRMRMSCHDAHYGGNLVDGAKMLQLFGDVATELLMTMSSSWLPYMQETISRPRVRSCRWAIPPARWSSRPER